MSEIKSMKTLSEVVTETADIVEAIIENHGELSDELELQFSTNAIDLKHKLDGYAYLWERLEIEQSFFKAKSEQMLKVSKSLEKVNKSLKERLKAAMNHLETTELAGGEFKFKLAKTSGKLVINDESLVPDKFKVQIVLDQVDKSKLKEALAAGVVVPGAELIKEPSLRKYINRGK